MFIVGLHPEEIHPARFENQCLRLCDFKIYAVSVLSYIGSTCAPDKATLKAHALQWTTAGPYNAVPTGLSRVGSVCGLGPDIVGKPFYWPRGPLPNCRVFKHAQPRA